jgi:hypothetical protein
MAKKSDRVVVKFLGKAPSGIDGYGEVKEIGSAVYEVYKKTGMYEMEEVKATKKTTKKEEPAKEDKKEE